MKKEQITKEQAIQRFAIFFDIFYFYHKRDIESINFGKYLIGRVVLISFACEIGIKSMVKYEGGEIPYTHKLDVLFGKLNPDTQKVLINESGYESDDFNTLIKENNSHFEEWRYLYNASNANLKFLESLLVAIVKILLPEKYKSLQGPIVNSAHQSMIFGSNPTVLSRITGCGELKNIFPQI